MVGGAASTQSGGRVMVVAASSMQATQRGGSAESALSTRSARLAGESLRAAGIAMRTGGRAQYGAVPQDRDADPFADRELRAGEFRRAKSGFGVGQVVEWEDEERFGDFHRLVLVPLSDSWLIILEEKINTDVVAGMYITIVLMTSFSWAMATP